MVEFDISDAADQQFGTIINQRRVTMRVRFNPTSNRWSLDLSIDDEPVLHGRRIVPGADLLAPFDFGIGIMFCKAAVVGSEPDFDGLSSGRVRLYHTDAEEVAEILAS